MWCNEKGPFWAAKFLLVFICILIIRISTLKSPQYSHIYDRKIIFISEKNIIILNLIFESGGIFFQHEHSVVQNPTIEIDLLTLFDLFSIWIFRRYFFLLCEHMKYVIFIFGNVCSRKNAPHDWCYYFIKSDESTCVIHWNRLCVLIRITLLSSCSTPKKKLKEIF